MDSACPDKDATEILRDSDHSTKVAPTTVTQILERHWEFADLLMCRTGTPWLGKILLSVNN